MKFNINDSVKVKLTEQGFLIHKRDWDSVMLGTNSTYLPPKVDKEGFSTFQMWHLISIFGPHINMSSPLPFLSEIEL